MLFSTSSDFTPPPVRLETSLSSMSTWRFHSNNSQRNELHIKSEPSRGARFHWGSSRQHKWCKKSINFIRNFFFYRSRQVAFRGARKFPLSEENFILISFSSFFTILEGTERAKRRRHQDIRLCTTWGGIYSSRRKLSFKLISVKLDLFSSCDGGEKKNEKMYNLIRPDVIC